MASKKEEKTAAAETKEMSKDEQVGFHKGSLTVLAKERQELQRILGIVEQLMQMQTTPEEKLKSQNAIGDVYFNAGRSEEAIQAYRKTLESDPNNLDALRGMGMTLVGTGDESRYPEVIDVLTKFTDKAAKAAATDPKRAQEVEDAKQVIAALKDAVKTQKKK